MTSEMNAIKQAYEDAGMSPQEIAIDRELDEAAVKACLMQVSSMYRKACGQEDEEKDTLNFSNDQLQRANEVIYETALSAEDPHLRFKAAIYIRDDKKGRKEVVKQMAGNNFNVLMINQQLQKVRELADSAKKSIPTRPTLELVNV